MSIISDPTHLAAARRSHVLEYLAQHPAGATAREIHAAATESGEAVTLDWVGFPVAALRVLEGLYAAGEVALVPHPMGKPADPIPGPLDWRYVIAQLALL